MPKIDCGKYELRKEYELEGHEGKWIFQFPIQFKDGSIKLAFTRALKRGLGGESPRGIWEWTYIDPE